MIIAGIGSKETPEEVCSEMNVIGAWCKEHHITIRSGHAPGADQAFETAEEYCVAYIPWLGFEKAFVSNATLVLYQRNQATVDLARKYHPKYDYLSFGTKKLMERNIWQVLGEDLKTPAKAIVCWTKGAKLVGGTSQALRVAKDYNIPVINMALEEYNTAESVVAVLKTIMGV